MVYHVVVQTTKEYMREVTAIDPKWLVEYAPAFFKFSDPTKLSNFKKNQRIEPLFNKYEEKKRCLENITDERKEKLILEVTQGIKLITTHRMTKRMM